MKRIFIISLFDLLFIQLGLSQEYPKYGQVEIFPENPTTNDTIELRTTMITMNWGWAQWTDFSLDDTIKISNCLYSSPYLPAPYSYRDTFQFGKLDVGEYIVEIKGYMTSNYDSCVPQYQNDSIISFFVLAPAGTKTLSSKSSISSFPNPTSSTITFESRQEFDQIIIRDFSSDILVNKRLPSANIHTHDLSNLSSGLYMVQIINNGNIQYCQIVIKK